MIDGKLEVEDVDCPVDIVQVLLDTENELSEEEKWISSNR